MTGHAVSRMAELPVPANRDVDVQKEGRHEAGPSRVLTSDLRRACLATKKCPRLQLHGGGGGGGVVLSVLGDMRRLHSAMRETIAGPVTLGGLGRVLGRGGQFQADHPQIARLVLVGGSIRSARTCFRPNRRPAAVGIVSVGMRGCQIGEIDCRC